MRGVIGNRRSYSLVHMTEKTIVNPFVFPSFHKILFIVLIITILLPAISVSWLYVKTLNLALSTITKIVFLSFPINIFIVLPSLTSYFYFYDPKRRIRKERLEEIGNRYPEISSFIHNYSRRLEIESPIILWSDSRYLEAEVFGNHRKIYLKITDGVCRMFLTNRELTEPIILHELSHLKNGDLVRHMIAEKLVKSYLILLSIHVAIFLSTLPFSSEIFFHFHSYWLEYLYVFPTVILYLVNGQLIRVRELYADARTTSIQRNVKKLLTLLRLFASKRSLFDIIKGKLSAIERIKALKDHSLIFIPRVEYGIVLGLLLACYESGITAGVISILPVSISGTIYGSRLLTAIFMVTSFILFSILFLPYYFLIAWKGLKLLIYSMKFYIGLILGYMIYAIYEYDFLIEPIWHEFRRIFLIATVLYLALILQLVSVPIFFAHQSLSRKTKLAIIISITAIPLTLVTITPHLLFILYIVYALLLLILRGFGRCPRCGTKLKDTKDIFICPRCSYRMNEWVFENIESD